MPLKLNKGRGENGKIKKLPEAPHIIN